MQPLSPPEPLAPALQRRGFFNRPTGINTWSKVQDKWSLRDTDTKVRHGDMKSAMFGWCMPRFWKCSTILCKSFPLLLFWISMCSGTCKNGTGALQLCAKLQIQTRSEGCSSCTFPCNLHQIFLSRSIHEAKHQSESCYTAAPTRPVSIECLRPIVAWPKLEAMNHWTMSSVIWKYLFYVNCGFLLE